MAKRWSTYRVYAKRPGGSWSYLGAESATSKTDAIRQFRSGHERGTKFKATRAGESREQFVNPSKRSVRKRVAAALKKYVRGNPPRVKGRKVKGGGRAVSLKNFTGTVVKKANGQVQIIGKGRK